MLEELEDEKLQELDFIELNACSGGCVGGIFAAENGYVARARIQRLRKYRRFPATGCRTQAIPNGWNGPNSWNMRRLCLWRAMWRRPCA